jgi:2-oxoglutarate ferredoxin oxidoreductase subunit beta
LDISALTTAAGANFVARSTVYHVTQLDKLLAQAIVHSGFAVVEVLSPCHTNFGRQNKLGSQVEMMKDFKKRAMRVERWRELSEPERKDRIATGVLVDRQQPSYLDLYTKVCKRARAMEGK